MNITKRENKKVFDAIVFCGKAMKGEREMRKYRHSLKSTKESSAKFGPCEICQGHVSEMFHQIEEMQYSDGWTRFECSDLFGHKPCLINQRKGGTT